MNKKQIRIPDFEDQATDLAVDVAYDLITSLLLAPGFAHVKGNSIRMLFRVILRKHKIYDKFINKVTKEFENSNGNGS